MGRLMIVLLLVDGVAYLLLSGAKQEQQAQQQQEHAELTKMALQTEAKAKQAAALAATDRMAEYEKQQQE